MRQLRPYKFVVQAIAQEVEVTREGDTIGAPPCEMAAVPGERVLGEVATEPVTLFGCDQLEQWARDFPEKLAAAETRD